MSDDPKISNGDLKIGVMNGDIASDFYQTAPCTIGYSYVRFEVTGAVKGCCISKYVMGEVGENKNWQEIWNGRAYDAFREKLKTIHKTHFHLKDPEWGFCQQCSHRQSNEDNQKILQMPFEEEEE